MEASPKGHGLGCSCAGYEVTDKGTLDVYVR